MLKGTSNKLFHILLVFRPVYHFTSTNTYLGAAGWSLQAGQNST